MSNKPKDAYQRYLDRFIAEMIWQDVRTWRGPLADAFWEADDEDNVPPMAKTEKDTPHE